MFWSHVGFSPITSLIDVPLLELKFQKAAEKVPMYKDFSSLRLRLSEWCPLGEKKSQGHPNISVTGDSIDRRRELNTKKYHLIHEIHSLVEEEETWTYFKKQVLGVLWCLSGLIIWHVHWSGSGSWCGMGSTPIGNFCISWAWPKNKTKKRTKNKQTTTKVSSS